MLAVVFDPTGERLEERPEPVPGPGEVLLRTEYCGICGSDLHAGLPDFVPGTVMGHEFSATVLDVGDRVTGLHAGDRVVVNPNDQTCGHCAFCLAGARNLCEDIWRTSIGLARDGGLASQVVVPRRSVHLLPPGLDLAVAALTEPLAVALRTVRTAGFSVGRSAVVLGGGPIGLLVTAVLRAAGASRITVVEPNPSRREVAGIQGATETLDPTEGAVTAVFADSATKPDVVFVCGGVPSLVGEALEIVRPRGTVVVTGFSRVPPTFQSAHLLHKEVTVRGSFIYLGEFGQAIDLLAAGRVDVSSLISGIVPISRAGEAFARMRSAPDAIKYLITAHEANLRAVDQRSYPRADAGGAVV